MMTKQNELEEIKKFMSIIQETLDVTYYGLEGDSINILILLAKHKQNKEFAFTCKCISETPTPNENYKDIIKYMLSKINNAKKERRNEFVNIFDTYHIDILTKYNI